MQLSKAIIMSVVFLPIYTLLLLNTIIPKSTGFTLELIHPITPKSTLFQTRFSNTTTFNQESLDIARLDVHMQDYNFMVKVGVGTFKSKPPFIDYYFDMDTGSSLTWMQCEGCTKCFAQIPNPFPPNKSASFQPVLHPQFKKPLTYNKRYVDGSSSSGICARETIHLNSNSKKGGNIRVPGFFFGCGLVNQMEYGKFKNNRIAGIMGLGWGDNSFVNQIKESKGRFSYCLPYVNLLSNKRRPKTYLRFGDDIVEQKEKAISTELIQVKDMEPYYVGLEGISINKKRLNISRDVFDGPKDYKGGCMIDSSTLYSHIIVPAYTRLIQGLEDYFSRNKNLQRAVIENGDFCYVRRKPEGFKNLPEITFHFKGSKDGLNVRPEGGFLVSKFKSLQGREGFCLTIAPSTDMTIIGAHQQTNQRIIYDTKRKKLIFYPENCSKNS